MPATIKTYYQGGAEFPLGKTERKTKAALKRRISDEPQNVYLFDTTAPILGGSKWEGMASDLPDDVIFNVVGPDPFTNRSWYASVYRNRKGALTVT